MSLLSSTQGTPERVWSLVSVIAGNGGALCKADAATWLNPGFTRNGESVQEKPTAFGQVLGAATSLGAVEADAEMLRLNNSCCVASYAAFCDWVNDTDRESTSLNSRHSCEARMPSHACKNK